MYGLLLQLKAFTTTTRTRATSTQDCTDIARTDDTAYTIKYFVFRLGRRRSNGVVKILENKRGLVGDRAGRWRCLESLKGKH